MSDLWQRNYEDVNGRLEPVKSPDLFVWVGVQPETGRVEMNDIQTCDDELTDLIKGWEWVRFRLVPDNIHDNIITYNRDEVRQASESVSKTLDRIDARRRNRMMLEFIGGAVFLIAFSLLMTYTIAGWMDAL